MFITNLLFKLNILQYIDFPFKPRRAVRWFGNVKLRVNEGRWL